MVSSGRAVGSWDLNVNQSPNAQGLASASAVGLDSCGMSSVAELVADVMSARQEVLEQVAALTADQAIQKPSEDEWSVAEIIEHLVLAEHMGVRKIWQAADGAGPGGAVEGPSNAGLSIEEVIAGTWKTYEQAPPDATPSGEGSLDYWTACFRACQPVLEELGTRLEGVDLSTVIFPHFLCGPLDARQRLEFLRFHIERHGRQIERLTARSR